MRHGIVLSVPNVTSKWNGRDHLVGARVDDRIGATCLIRDVEFSQVRVVRQPVWIHATGNRPADGERLRVDDRDLVAGSRRRIHPPQLWDNQHTMHTRHVWDLADDGARLDVVHRDRSGAQMGDVQAVRLRVETLVVKP